MPFRFNPFTDKLDLTETGSLPGTGILSLTGNSGGAVGPDGGGNVNVLGNNTQGIDITGNPGTNTLTVTAFNASSSQKGVATFDVTNFTVTSGNVVSNPITVNAGTGISVTGSPVNLGGAITISLGAMIATTYTEDSGVATPAANNLNIFGTSVQGISTSGAGSTVTITAANASNVQKGVASFNATNFTVTAGNVTSNNITVTGGTGVIISGSPVTLGGAITISLNGSVVGQTITGDTGGALPPTAGNWNILSAIVAAGTTPIVTAGSGSTLTIQIQRTQAAASTAANIVGVSSFNSSHFTVDANGWVSLSSTGPALTITGDSGGPLSPIANNWNIFGSSVAAGSTPVATSGAAATLTVNVQRSQAIASTNAANVGLAAFNSAQFTVDSNGFVSSLVGGFPWIDQGTSITMTANRGYFATAAVTLTLPASPSQGDRVNVFCDTASTVVVTANTGQTIRQGNLTSSSGGTFTNSLRGDSLILVYRAATTQWMDLGGQGVWVAA